MLSLQLMLLFAVVVLLWCRRRSRSSDWCHGERRIKQIYRSLVVRVFAKVQHANHRILYPLCTDSWWVHVVTVKERHE